MPFRGAGLVAPASRRQFCATAGVLKIAGGTPALPNPNLDDEARDHRTDPSNRREKPRPSGAVIDRRAPTTTGARLTNHLQYFRRAIVYKERGAV